MTPAERQQKIETYGHAYQTLLNALKQFPQAMWQFRGTREAWTIQEVIIHIADSEANSFIRARRAIAEPGSAVFGYDEMAWAKNLHYHDQSVADALELFKWLRGNTYRLIKNLSEAVWAHTIEHSENGPMTLEQWLDVYERHVTEHIAQMQKIHEDWKLQGG